MVQPATLVSPRAQGPIQGPPFSLWRGSFFSRGGQSFFTLTCLKGRSEGGIFIFPIFFLSSSCANGKKEKRAANQHKLSALNIGQSFLPFRGVIRQGRQAQPSFFNR